MKIFQLDLATKIKRFKLEEFRFLLTIRSPIIPKGGARIEDGGSNGWMDGFEIVARLVRVQISGEGEGN